MTKIIGYYTKNTPYKGEADNLIKTLNKFNLDYHIYEVENKKNWYLNCGQKSSVIKQALKDFKADILYVDVDARFLREPPLQDLWSDIPRFATWINRRRQFELLSGTIYFPNNEISKEIVQKWIEQQKKAPMVWDQKTLQTVVENNYAYLNLALEWCWIKEFMKNIKNPIIWHTQASRRLKRKVMK
jgi:hypothetical protein